MATTVKFYTTLKYLLGKKKSKENETIRKCNQCKCLDYPLSSPFSSSSRFSHFSTFRYGAVKVPDMQNRTNHFQFWRHIDLINLRASPRDNLIDNPRSSVCPRVHSSIIQSVSQSFSQSVSRFTRLSGFSRVCCCLHTACAPFVLGPFRPCYDTLCWGGGTKLV